MLFETIVFISSHNTLSLCYDTIQFILTYSSYLRVFFKLFRFISSYSSQRNLIYTIWSGFKLQFLHCYYFNLHFPSSFSPIKTCAMGVQSSTVSVMYTLYVPICPFSTSTVIVLLSEPIVYTPLNVKFPEINVNINIKSRLWNKADRIHFQ